MLNQSFIDSNENYITIPVMIKFYKKYDLNPNGTTRDEILRCILDFANENDENMTIFNNWLDAVLKQGIKHIYLNKIYFGNNWLPILRNPELCINKLEEAFPECPNNYLSNSRSNEELTLQKYQLEIVDNQVTKISFIFTRVLLEGDVGNTGNRITYPLFVDIDLTTSFIGGRAKSKTSIYRAEPGNDLIIESKKITTERLIINAITSIARNLNLRVEERARTIDGFKKSFYNTLKELTFTPEPIQELINNYDEKLKTFINEMFEEFNLDFMIYKDMAKSDLNIFLEKYISISWPDRDIFIKDRPGYPIKLSSTDSEDTKIEETSVLREPLQHKAKFFDNKKSIEHEKTCDSLSLCYNRINPIYYGKDPFTLKCFISSGYGVISFQQYVEEEDIQNVLSRIVNNREL